MKIIKPKHSYAELYQIEKKKKKCNAYRLGTLILCIEAFIFTLILFCISNSIDSYMSSVLPYLYNYLFSSSSPNQNFTLFIATSLSFISYIMICLIPIYSVFYILFLFTIKCAETGLLKYYFFYRIYFHQLCKVYQNAEKAITFLEPILDDVVIENMKNGIKIKYRSKTRNYYFYGYTKEIYKNGCLDFSILDSKIDNKKL